MTRMTPWSFLSRRTSFVNCYCFLAEIVQIAPGTEEHCLRKTNCTYKTEPYIHTNLNWRRMLTLNCTRDLSPYIAFLTRNRVQKQSEIAASEAGLFHASINAPWRLTLLTCSLQITISQFMIPNCATCGCGATTPHNSTGHSG